MTDVSLSPDAPDRPLAPRRDHGAARLVATVGLHGSASTWVFNVARELMIAALGADRVVSLFTEDAARILINPGALGRHVVVKAHWSGTGLEALLWLARASMLLSIRDPRDAVVSMRQRFDVPFEACVRAVSMDCGFVHRCADAGHPVLRYEDGFVADDRLPARIAGHLGIEVPGNVCAAIFARYGTEAVRAFARTVPTLPPERLVVAPVTMNDSVTQIHATHIGDGAVGKWRTLMTDEQQRETSRLFAPFLERFGYLP